MPQTIYMPQDQRWQSMERAVMGFSNNLLMPLVLGKIKHNMDMEIADRALKAKEIENKQKAEEQRAQIGLRGEESRKTETHKSKLPSKPGKPTALVAQYDKEMEQFRGGVGADPGPFGPWLEKRVKSGATRISFGEKTALHGAKKTISAEIDRKAKITSPDFKTKTAISLQKEYGDDWEVLEPWGREELIFKEMNRKVKEAYPNQNVEYNHQQRGWFNTDSGGLIKRYEYDLFHRGDQRH